MTGATRPRPRTPDSRPRTVIPAQAEIQFLPRTNQRDCRTSRRRVRRTPCAGRASRQRTAPGGHVERLPLEFLPDFQQAPARRPRRLRLVRCAAARVSGRNAPKRGGSGPGGGARPRVRAGEVAVRIREVFRLVVWREVPCRCMLPVLGLLDASAARERAGAPPRSFLRGASRRRVAADPFARTPRRGVLTVRRASECWPATVIAKRACMRSFGA